MVPSIFLPGHAAQMSAIEFSLVMQHVERQLSVLPRLLYFSRKWGRQLTSDFGVMRTGCLI